MRLQLDTHPGVILEDPEWQVLHTVDRPAEQTFTPTIVLDCGPNLRVLHRLPPQPYVNGTWGDEHVSAAVQAYLPTLEVG
ncbi:MAG: hypothetical protein KIT10_14520 [Flavobacteriales bacterium]|nr:hypothetical protein [Flavobacteriales bacterium]